MQQSVVSPVTSRTTKDSRFTPTSHMTRFQTDMAQFVPLNYIQPSLNFIRYKLLTLSKLMVLRVAQASPKVAFHRVLIIYAWENLIGCIPWSIVSFSSIVEVWLPSITGLSLWASFLGVLHPSPGWSFFPALLTVLFGLFILIIPARSPFLNLFFITHCR